MLLPGPEILFEQALSLSGRGHFDEAHAHYLAALKQLPGNVDLLSNIGFNLNSAGRYSEAEQWLSEAIKIAPEALSPRINLSIALRKQGKVEGALAALNETASTHSAEPDLFYELGCVLTDMGHFPEAERNFHRAMELQPDHARAWIALLNSRKMTPEDSALLVAGEKLLRSALPVHDRISLLYLFGKYYDDTGDHARAFDYFRQANELKKSTRKPYDRLSVGRICDLFINSHDPGIVRKTYSGSSDSPRPVFVVGMPRSGTSLVEQIIASHPLVHGAGELNFWAERINRDRRRIMLADYGEDLISDIASEYLSYMERYPSTVQRVVDKMPANFRFLGPLHVIFPKAKFIHVKRDPIDTCLSVYFQDFSAQHSYANDLNDLAHYYGEYRRIMAHWQSVLPPEAMLEVSYEDLVESQVDWTRRMLDFLDLEWDPRCIEFYNTERRIGTASNWQARQPLYKTSRQRWRNYERYIDPLRVLL